MPETARAQRIENVARTLHRQDNEARGRLPHHAHPWDLAGSLQDRYRARAGEIVDALAAIEDDPITEPPEPDRESFCFDLGPRIADTMESLGIEDANYSDGRMVADLIFCLGYRLPTVAPQITRPDPPDGLCGEKGAHHPHLHDSVSLGTFWCTADQATRQPFAGEQEQKRRAAERARGAPPSPPHTCPA